MKNRILKTGMALLMVGVLLAGIVIPAGAEAPYQSYLYDTKSQPVGSANAYSATRLITGQGVGLNRFYHLSDMVYYDDHLFVLDSGNTTGSGASLTILDKDLNLVRQLTEFRDASGSVTTLNQPEGIEIYKYLSTEDAGRYDIVICDTGNSRIIRVDMEGNLVFEYPEPDLSILNTETNTVTYKPRKVAFDSTNRLYIIAENVNQGLVCLDPDGEFNCFFGAPEVTADAFTKLWRRIMSLAGGQGLISYTPTEYSNVVSDDKGFIYGTIAIPDQESFQLAFDTQPGDEARSAAPNIVRLNSAGEDVLKRLGYIPNNGDQLLEIKRLISYDKIANDAVYTGFCDVALGGNGVYSCVDRTYGRVFTYDTDGNLLYVFGNGGTQVDCAQMGTVRNPAAIAYMGDNILVADGWYNTITVFTPTDYGAKVLEAASLYYRGEYEASEAIWTDVLKRNSNMFYAYIGAGKALYRNGEYAESMKYFKEVENRTYYSKARKLYLKSVTGNWFTIIFLVIVVLVLGFKIFKGVRQFRSFMKNGVKKVM